MATAPDGEKSLLQDIKKLLILQLLSQGMQQTHIAAVLGISDATMSRMLPKGLSNSIKKDRG
jgi:DNA-binding transcriptional regulator LsrR (DeoR family)